MKRILGVAVAALLGLAGAAPAQAHPLVTAISDAPPAFTNPNGFELAFTRAHQAGTTAFIIYVHWGEIAPDPRPADFNPSNPFDPRYRWGYVDSQVRLARANGMEPVFILLDAPSWAEGSLGGPRGTNSPDPGAFAEFAGAEARRYDGTNAGIPRVVFHQIWNEVNASISMNPVFDAAGNPASVDRYREMVNRAAAQIHAAAPGNQVIAGGLFPFEIPSGNVQAVGAQRYMRALLCMSAGRRPQRTCNQQVDFDIWSTHPYTSGNAFHRAAREDSISLGDLPRMRALLRAAAQQGAIAGGRSIPPFWVTEFGWDSNPPDPNGVPVGLLTRWVAEALYQSYRSGISFFGWYQLQDDPMEGPDASIFQNGLYQYCGGGIGCGEVKPIEAAFRFPFVAYRTHRRVRAWGRTPFGDPGQVAIEQLRSGAWRELRRLRANRDGIFSYPRLRARGSGPLRARLVSNGDASPAFDLRRPRDRPGTNPFG